MAVPSTPQHYIECEMCDENCLYHCNSCYVRLCEKCRDNHKINPYTKAHDISRYNPRILAIPLKKCPRHRTKDLDMHCKECQIPLCSNCAIAPDHHGHTFEDLEEIYSKHFEAFKIDLCKIYEYFLPASNDVLDDIQDDVTKVKKMIGETRRKLKLETEAVKREIETAFSEKMAQLEKIERETLKDLYTQTKTMTDYISYLNGLAKKYQFKLVNKDPEYLVRNEAEGINSIPKTSKPAYPTVIAGNLNKAEVLKALSKIFPNVSTEERNVRKLFSLKSLPHLQFIKQNQKDMVNSRPCKRWKMSNFVTEAEGITVQGLKSILHVSKDQADRLWVSEFGGNLVQTDKRGNRLRSMKISGTGRACHTMTLMHGNLLFIGKENNVIYKISDDKIIKFVKTEDWTALSIYSSYRNEDILMGMIKDDTETNDAKVTRYSKTGKKIQDIKNRNRCWTGMLYKFPDYLTENINGDICVSDRRKEAVVVVNKAGKYRFSYTGQQPNSEFSPCGICTSTLGHILICDPKSYSIHLLDKDGLFLSLLNIGQSGLVRPCGLCVDLENQLYVGYYESNALTRYTLYKY
ncbi:uncharacterized protein LOC134281288 [Saccostrea cucullata]|uniref:uncharacterized protein LOC134238114 n=1 Tax=Saccostrea cuccullata TaxID=36930 RepID=UPI002ED2F60F